jgi:hypothetical protein
VNEPRTARRRMSPEQPPAGEGVTVREVYALVQRVEADLLTKLDAVQTAWTARLESHETVHATDRASWENRIRWAVTTILTGFGVVIAIWAAIRH